MSTLATNAITDASGGNTATINSYTPTESNMAGGNRIINGDMRIDQRNAGASLTFTGAPYTLDRWKLNGSSGGVVQQITSTIPEFAKSLKYTSNASNSFLQMGQQIEYLNCYDLQNKTVTISFWVKANNSNAGSTAFKVRTRINAAVDAATIFQSANTDTAVTITTTATKYTVTRTLSTFGSLSLEFVLGAHVSGDGFEITGVQLEAGSVATPFEHRQYGQELALCQRYYYKSPQQANGEGFITYQATGGWTGTTCFPVTMRATPTMTYGYTSPYTGNTFLRVDTGGTITVTLGQNLVSASRVMTIYDGGKSSIPLGTNFSTYLTASAEL